MTLRPSESMISITWPRPSHGALPIRTNLFKRHVHEKGRGIFFLRLLMLSARLDPKKIFGGGTSPRENNRCPISRPACPSIPTRPWPQPVFDDQQRCQASVSATQDYRLSISDLSLRNNLFIPPRPRFDRVPVRGGTALPTTTILLSARVTLILLKRTPWYLSYRYRSVRCSGNQCTNADDERPRRWYISRLLRRGCLPPRTLLLPAELFHGGIWSIGGQTTLILWCPQASW